MICYRDRSYCNEIKCQNTDCSRRVTVKIMLGATEANLPIRYAAFRDTELCVGFIERLPSEHKGDHG